MRIKGIEHLTDDQIMFELRRGGRFVIYQYCVSILIVTFKRPSDIYFVRAGESAAWKGIGYTLISLIFGWWGIPFGIIYTIQSLVKNFSGGTDVTEAILSEAGHEEIERAEEQQQQSVQHGQQVQQVSPCRTCGSRNILAARFCGTCGARVVIHCPRCGATVAPGYKFCTGCGSRLS